MPNKRCTDLEERKVDSILPQGVTPSLDLCLNKGNSIMRVDERSNILQKEKTIKIL